MGEPTPMRSDSGDGDPEEYEEDDQFDDSAAPDFPRKKGNKRGSIRKRLGSKGARDGLNDVLRKAAGYHGVGGQKDKPGFEERRFTLHGTIIRWYDLKDSKTRPDGTEIPKARCNLAHAVWYTDEPAELRKIAEEMELPWPRPDNNPVRGFAMEIKGGRVLLIACDSAEVHKRWIGPVKESVPEHAKRAEILMHHSAQHLAKERTKIYRMNDDKYIEKTIRKCGPHKVTKHSPHILYMDICINNFDIHTETASIALDVWIQLVWENELLEGVDTDTPEGLDAFIRAEPEIEFINAVKMDRIYMDAANSRVIFTDPSDDKTYCQTVRRYSGFMKDLDMDISRFPFDSQTLEFEMQIYGSPVQFKDYRKLCRVVLCEIEDIRYSAQTVMGMLSRGQKNYIPEIHGLESLRFDLIGAQTEIQPVKYDFLGMHYAKCRLLFKIQRKSTFFVVRVYGILSLVVALACLSLNFSPAEFEQRLNVVLSLFLAIVALQFTIQDVIPNIGYMTWLDFWLVSVYIFMVAIGYAAMVVNRKFLNGDEDGADRLDYFFLRFFPSVWILYTIAYGAAAMYVQAKDRWKMWREDKGWTAIDNHGNVLPNALLADNTRHPQPEEVEKEASDFEPDTTDEESGTKSTVRRLKSKVSRSKSKDFSTFAARNPAASF